MSQQAAEEFWNNADEEAREWLSRALFKRELETIRRKQLLDPAIYKIKHVDLFRRDTPTPGGVLTIKPAQLFGRSSYQKLGSFEGIRGGATPSLKRQRSLSSFPLYLTRLLAKVTTIIDDYDDDDKGKQGDKKRAPTDTQHDFTDLRLRLGYTQPIEQHFPREIEAANVDFLTTGFRRADRESMLSGPDWLPYLRKYDKGPGNVLFKGFPTAEDVTFVMHPNYWTEPEKHGKLVDSGQCYWLALALLLYGDASFWLRVKAEHLSYLEKVLKNAEHPRHEYYAKACEIAFPSHATGPASHATGSAAFSFSDRVTLWENFQIPGCWTNQDTCTITADVYGVFLVLYKYDSSSRQNPQWRGKVYDMKTYGSYNNRHIFLCYHVENHFRPMVPNDFYEYEFKLPRLTLEATKKYSLETGPLRKKLDGPGHHWRDQGIRGTGSCIPTPLSRPSFEPEHLGRAHGYQPEPRPDQRGNKQSSRDTTQKPPASSASPGAQQRNVNQADIKTAQNAADYLARFTRRLTPGGHPVPAGQDPAVLAGPSTPGPATARGTKRLSAEAPGTEVHPAKRHAGTIPPPQHKTPTPTSGTKPYTPLSQLLSNPNFTSSTLLSNLPPSSAPRTANPFTPSPGDKDKGKGKEKLSKDELIALLNPQPHSKGLYKDEDDNDDEYEDKDGLDSDDDEFPALDVLASRKRQPKPPPPPQQQQLPTPNPTPKIRRPKRAKQPQPDDDEEEDEDDNTTFRPATKTLLTRLPKRRLAKWCQDLNLDTPAAVRRWLKEACVSALFGARVEVRMRPTGLGGEVVVGEAEETQGRGVVVVRLPVQPVGPAGAGGGAAAGTRVGAGRGAPATAGTAGGGAAAGGAGTGASGSGAGTGTAGRRKGKKDVVDLISP